MPPMIQLPVKDPCDLCAAAREEPWKIVEECEHTLTLITPWQFEQGQCCVVTRRHVALLLDLTREECEAVLVAAQRVARALDRAFQPLGILTFQNNGVYSGQETPHFHFHVVPRQPGSDWGIGPPQLATFEGAGRRVGTVHDPSDDAARRERVRAPDRQLAETAARIRANLPGTLEAAAWPPVAGGE
jgi:histidine triad (HIT) family protein